nr:hypothetical protein YSBCXYJI_YSBCXYJI_CDS_0034 [Caudoviricetes sp.]CAI9751677.1 hypothetical protein YSBCXYJI_YSBCXYJI_CDS_0035 [Caudoviricetes sp.]DAI22707.1 MAG TPA: hypothetical protein [Caudoviricetes sp.]
MSSINNYFRAGCFPTTPTAFLLFQRKILINYF